MAKFKYLIVGGGMTADSAVQGIREIDAHGEIGILGNEPAPPYDRPPLSKGLWKDKSEEDIWRKTEAAGVRLLLEKEVTAIEPGEKKVVVDGGEKYEYEKLLLATGGRPRRLPHASDEILYYRTFQDYRRLREWTEQKKSFAVIGGGFIGSEIAAALAMNGKDVTMIFPERGIGARVFPSDLAGFLNGYYEEKGVSIIAGKKPTGFGKGAVSEITIENGDRVTAGGIVAGIGITPNVELAENARLDVDNGIVVDEMLRTRNPDIYAAGDVANFYTPLLDKRLRVEHEDNANTMGKTAGRNMAGECEKYHHLPFFYSDMFDLGYEAVGEIDSQLQTISLWEEPNRKGIIFYLNDARCVRGAVFWNTWDMVDAGREIIGQEGPFDREKLQAWAKERTTS